MTTLEPITKRCRDCRQTRPATGFLPSRFTDDRLTDRCRVCVFNAASQDRVRREARRTQREVNPSSALPST